MKHYAESKAGVLCIQSTEKKADWFGHILRRNCLLKRVIEGKIEGRIEVRGRRGRRREHSY